MKSFLLSILLLSAIAHNAMAQIIVSGHVSEKTSGEDVVCANIIIKDHDNHIVQFTSTDAKGNFRVELAETQDGLTLTATMLGFKPYTNKIKAGDTKGMQIRMEEDNFVLKEVTVKSERVVGRGDTVTYNVAGFAKQDDRTIGDVLKRMPGIEVDDNGKIQYQGTDINKFYIEGADLLGGKYGIATQGINYNDIGAVEVLENHQPLQVLRGVSYSDRAAINLRLKDKSKATWVANGHAGAGTSTRPQGVLWDADVFLMGVFDKRQSIITAKTNNTGINLGRQLTDLISDRRMTDLSEYVTMELPSTPSLKDKRTRFNRSHMLSVSNLQKYKDFDFKTQVDYCNQRVNSSAITKNIYYMKDEDKTITESTNAVKHENQLTGRLTVEADKKTYFLSNILKTELEWNDLSTSLSGSTNNFQKTRQPDYFLSNSLNIIKRFGGKHFVSFTSTNEWERLPQSFSVYHNRESTALRQDTRDNAVFSKEQAGYSFRLKRFNISIEGGIEAYLRSMKGLLTDSANTSGNAGEVSTRTNYLRFFISPKIEYNLHDFDLTLSYPFNITCWYLSKSLGGSRNITLSSPTFNIRWRSNSYFTVILGGGLGSRPSAISNIYNGILYSDYRTARLGMSELFVNSMKNLSGRISYRNTSNGFFANMYAIESWTEQPYTSSRKITGNSIIYSYVPSSVNVRNIMTMCNMSKLLGFMRGAFSVNFSVSHTTSSMIAEGQSTNFANTSVNVRPRLNGSINKTLDFSYEMSYTRSTLCIDKSTANKVNNFEHDLSITVSPASRLTWNVGCEYYDNQITPEQRKHILMLDTDLTWKVSRKIELQASLTNILNKRRYSYTTTDNLSATENIRYMRGRELMLTVFLNK